MGYSALIIEDNEAFRVVLAEMLTQVGFEVTGARDGTEAMHLLQGNLPDLMTLDINIPGVSGLDILRYIRQVNGGERTTAVVLSGDHPTDHAEAAAIADMFLVKPVGMATLFTLAERIMRDPEKGQAVPEPVKSANPGTLNKSQ